LPAAPVGHFEKPGTDLGHQQFVVVLALFGYVPGCTPTTWRSHSRPAFDKR
jgi:hypothetical protein